VKYSQLSVVIVTHNEGDTLAQTVEAVTSTSPGAELVVVDDISTDGSTDFLARHEWRNVLLVKPGRRLGVATARNLGARHSAAPTLVFSDAHVRPEPGWAEALRETLADPAIAVAGPGITDLGGTSTSVGYGFTWEDSTMTARWLTDRPAAMSSVPFLCGCFVATRRPVFEGLGRFDEGLRTWGHEDAEYSLRAWLGGYRCVVAPSATVAHKFRSTFAYRVDPATVLHNRLRTGVLHLSPLALTRLLCDARADPAFPAAYHMLLTSDVWRRRDLVRGRRGRSDQWFFDEFGIRGFGPH
jgi:GT2 family glycosyltransferase